MEIVIPELSGPDELQCLQKHCNSLKVTSGWKALVRISQCYRQDNTNPQNFLQRQKCSVCTVHFDSLCLAHMTSKLLKCEMKELIF